MRTKIIAYWTVTILIALETLVGGVTDLVHGKEILVAGPPVADIVTHLGYPLYVLRIIGVWKAAGRYRFADSRLPTAEGMGLCRDLLRVEWRGRFVVDA